MEATTAVRTFKDIDRTILQAIPNPSDQAYEIKTKFPEFTFLRVKEQPDDLQFPGRHQFEAHHRFGLEGARGKEKFNDWQRIEDE